MKFWLAAVLLLFASVGAISKEIVPICAKAQRQDGSWGNNYKVAGNLMKGSELNAATNSYNYTDYDTYVVIFWGDGQASIIKLNISYFGLYFNEGADQYGKKWNIDKRLSAVSECY